MRYEVRGKTCAVLRMGDYGNFVAGVEFEHTRGGTAILFGTANVESGQQERRDGRQSMEYGGP